MKKLLLASFLAVAAVGVNAQHCGNCRHSSGPKVIAHRGHWNAPGSAQNSIRSLQLADSVGAYGSEFDVWLTADSVLVLNHDNSINGIVIQESPAAIVLAQKLPNGENVPTLNDFLDVACALNINLVLELKEHSSPAINQYAADKCVEMVRDKGLYDRTDYITFSPYAFTEFIKEAPGREVSFLYELILPDRIKELGGTGIDYNIGHFKNNPKLTQECHDMGLKVNIWTVDSPDDISFSINQGVDYITTNDPVLCSSMIKEAIKSKHSGNHHHDDAVHPAK